MKFVLASHNKGKLAEMQAVLADLGIEVVMPADLGIYVDVEETGETFAENAALKANAIMEASGLPAIADDSGLCVNWLGGAPGVYSARYGGLDAAAARYRLLLRRHCLCAYGRRRIRLRSGVPGAVPAQDLRPADSGGEERHLPPRQRSAEVCGRIEGISGK